MDKQALIQKLSSSHETFLSLFDTLTDEQFLIQPEGKWSVGQHLDHIYRSVKPLSTGVRTIPKFLIRLRFGKMKRPSRSYNEVVENYLSVLENGGKASGEFVPESVSTSEKTGLQKSLKNEMDSLVSGFDSYSESDLDEIALPHPLLGDISLREMLYFTIYHVQHHQAIVERTIELYA